MKWSRIPLALAAFLFAGFVSAQGRELPDFVKLVEEQGAAVVNISTTQAVRRPTAAIPQIPGIEDEEVQEFFRRFMPRQQPGPQQGPRAESRSLGSGFVISADGYILTNAHVVDSADEITVKLTDKREYKAKVIGADKRTDVALIKIEPSAPLPIVKIADPSKLKVGEWVARDRFAVRLRKYRHRGNRVRQGAFAAAGELRAVHPDRCAINPGNSGGPLFNMRGEVVGMNSQIYSRTGGYMGLAFAIPIRRRDWTSEAVREKGHVRAAASAS